MTRVVHAFLVLAIMVFATTMYRAPWLHEPTIAGAAGAFTGAMFWPVLLIYLWMRYR